MKHHVTTDEPWGRFELHFSSKFYLDGVFAPYGHDYADWVRSKGEMSGELICRVIFSTALARCDYLQH
jgi:hypothetical protein